MASLSITALLPQSRRISNRELLFGSCAPTVSEVAEILSLREALGLEFVSCETPTGLCWALGK